MKKSKISCERWKEWCIWKDQKKIERNSQGVAEEIFWGFDIIITDEFPSKFTEKILIKNCRNCLVKQSPEEYLHFRTLIAKICSFKKIAEICKVNTKHFFNFIFNGIPGWISCHLKKKKYNDHRINGKMKFSKSFCMNSKSKCQKMPKKFLKEFSKETTNGNRGNCYDIAQIR